MIRLFLVVIYLAIGMIYAGRVMQKVELQRSQGEDLSEVDSQQNYIKRVSGFSDRKLKILLFITFAIFWLPAWLFVKFNPKK